MSGGLRQATDEDLILIWPAIRAAHLFPGQDAFREWRNVAPWRVLTNDRGDAAIVVPWRSHLDLLALRALWCAPRRTSEFLGQIREVASAHGFTRLVSPLLAQDAVRPYLRAGMVPKEHLVALRAMPGQIQRSTPPEGVTLREAMVTDVEAIASLEAACFDEFWRHGTADIRGDIGKARVVVAWGGDEVVGYTLCGVSHGNVTLGRLAVAPAARRHGVARALVSDVAEYAEGQGAAAVTLCTQLQNEASRALYARCGFRELPETLVIATDRSTPVTWARAERIEDEDQS